jgi:hypothetical protein
MLYLRRLALAAALLPAAVFPLRAQTAAPAPAEQVAARHAPTMVGGVWCGAGLLGGFTLEIAQQYQKFEAKLIRKGRVREITGHLEGATLHTDPQRDHTMELLARGDELRITDATGQLALARGQFFTRAVGGSCTN